MVIPRPSKGGDDDSAAQAEPRKKTMVRRRGNDVTSDSLVWRQAGGCDHMRKRDNEWDWIKGDSECKQYLYST